MRPALLLVVFVCSAHAATYYVDCAGGSDAASGASPAAAWRSPGKVSASTFAPGDAILLRRGAECVGTLWPKGSGENGNPIRLGAYGEGPLPRVRAAGAEAAVKLENQQFWEIETLDASGGDPYGVYIAADGARTIRHLVLRNLAVHDVGGTAKTKASGLVVVSATHGARLEDVTIDGVTACRTSQWAGIYVSGSDARARGVVVRNSIVHEVAGDGIIIFLAEDARIEKSAAWHTGLEEKETIGTPNAIWTWTCRRCTVENNEGFWIDSPGVDGGVYDIDWGNEDNVVQHNYAHDAQGYCAAIFGAGKRPTSNSAIRYNVCVNNGRSPKLARRQGDIYTATWDGGSLDGIAIEHNTIVWNPPIDAPAFQMKDTAFSGTRPNRVAGNTVWSSAAALVEAAAPVRFENNTWWHPGRDPARWCYGPRPCGGFDAWRGIAPGDRFASPGLESLLPSPPPRPVVLPASIPHGPGWLLLMFGGKAEPDARSQMVFLQAALAQYGGAGLDAAIVVAGGPNLPYDWDLGAVRRIEGAGLDRALRIQTAPVLLLVSPKGEIVRRWDGFASPSDLGLTLKHYLGSAAGNPALPFDQ
jgi:hypothetical protein